MLHAAAMLGATALIWMTLTQRWSSPQDWLIAGVVGLACTVFAWRFGGATSAFARSPRLVMANLARAPAVLRGGLATLRSAISADVAIKPALVRIKTRSSRSAEIASFAAMLSAAPGAVVVASDDEGLLVHVLNEDQIDASELGRIERSVGVSQ